LAVDVGIVDDRRKEVDGLDDGQLLRQLIDPGVVVGLGADQEMRIVAARKVAQNLRDALGGQLPSSAGARSVVEQTFFPTKKQHTACPQINRQDAKNAKRRMRKKGLSRLLDLFCYFCLLSFFPWRSWRLGGSFFLFQPRADHLQHRLLVGKLLGFELGVQEFPVGGQLEAAPTGGEQLQILDLLLERGQQFARQTDGLRFVPSHGAVA
jgi:hypothetical protein